MLRTFLIISLSFCCSLLNAQNIFNPADTLVTYNASAPAGSLKNPAIPKENVMSKWVHASWLAWNASNFKCYIWNGMAFRLRFPNNYNPANADKYPVIVYFHGGGEVAPVYDNEYQLYVGAQLFEQRINNKEWNGFLLFPQQTSIGWDDYYFSRINSVLDTLQKYNNTDPDRTLAMGISSGGYGAVAYGDYYPRRVAASLAASPAYIRGLSGDIQAFKHIPQWLANGGVDANPDPYNARAFYSDFRNAGGNIYQTYLANNFHDTWTNMWDLKDASGRYITTTWWNDAHKAQPLVYFQHQQFCNGTPIAAKMGISAGYAAYEWDLNGALIAGATANEYTAAQAGQYRVRFRRTATGPWSAWTPQPVVISTKACATDTLYAEHFTNDNTYSSALPYSTANFTCQGGIMTSGTDLITQDASGVQGNRFLINYTLNGNGCSFAANDKVWNISNPVAVLPDTSYEFSFYLANQNSVNPARLAPVINGTALIPGSVSATGTGNSSWKKYTYTWKSGKAVSADLGIINRLNEFNGNDFAIDEISFKLATPPVPECVTNLLPLNGDTIITQTTAGLSWTSSPTATSYDVYIWTGATIPATATANVTTTSYNATGLLPSTLYKWFVIPRNTNGAATACGATYTTSFTSALLPAAFPTKLYPNPAKPGQDVTLQFISEHTGTATIKVMGIRGHLHYTQKINAVIGLNKILLHTSFLSEGVYIVQITGNKEIAATLKLIIQ